MLVLINTRIIRIGLAIYLKANFKRSHVATRVVNSKSARNLSITHTNAFFQEKEFSNFFKLKEAKKILSVLLFIR